MDDHDKHPCAARCGKCGHVQIIAWTPMNVAVFSRLIKSVICRWCGNGPKNMFLASDAEAALCGPPVFSAQLALKAPERARETEAETRDGKSPSVLVRAISASHSDQ